MDNPQNPKPAPLKNWQEKLPAPSENTGGKPTPPTPQTDKPSGKGCLIGVLSVIIMGIFWKYWIEVINASGFLATWFLVSCFGLKAKKSKIPSIGGGLILAVMMFLTTHAIFNEREANYTGQFEPAAAYRPPEVNSRSRAELLALFDELQAFRSSPGFHEYGFSRLGEISWKDRLKQLQEWESKAEDSESSAANSLETLALLYFHSKGRETDGTRLIRETMEELIGAPRLVTERQRSDFENILSGTDEATIGDVSVTNLGDLMAETMGERIDWTLAERVLLCSNTLDTKLVSFDDGYLYQVTPDSEGRSIPFALRRTPDIEEKTASGYATQRERYEALMRGESSSVDPLKRGYILVTSGVTKFDFSKEKKILNDYHKATHGEVEKWGFEICRVRVIVLE